MKKGGLPKVCTSIPLILVICLSLIGVLVGSNSGYCSTIAAAEYFIDRDPGEGNGIALSPKDGAFDSAEESIELSGIDTSSLKIGSHTLYVRFKSSDRVWGVARPISFDPSFSSPYNFRITGKKWITAAEYFIDVDPGEGNGTAILPKDGAFDEAQEEFEVSGIDISSLGAGFHKLFLRLKDNEGNWGIVREVTFEIYEPFTIAGAEYFIDEDPGPGQGIALSPKDGFFNSAEEEIDLSGIDLSGLSEGVHVFHVRFKDNIGRWGEASSQIFSIRRPVSYALSTPVQPTVGDERVPVSVVVADQSGSDTCKLKVEWSYEGSDNWQNISIEEGSVSASYGSPSLDNSTEYQIGNSSGWIRTSSGPNTISFVWLPVLDLGNTEADGIRLRFTINNGIDEQVTSTETAAFRVDFEAPAIPVPIVYRPDPTGDTTPELSWSAVNEAARYHVQIAKDSSFSTIVLDDSNVGTTSFTPSSSLPLGDIYWRVSAIDSLGNESAFCVPDHFVIVSDTEGPSVTLTYSSSSPVSAGHLTITATFSEPITTVPTIAINQPGSIDLAPIEMSGSGTTWHYTYNVHCADGSNYVDGTATISITNGFDSAGHENGPAQNNTFTIDTSACGSGIIIAAEYFIDRDPGEGNGIALSPKDGAFDSAEESIELSGIDTSSLKIGSHTLYVRFKSSDGVWGVARPISFDPSFSSPYNFRITGKKWITAAEYFIDVDPGEGNGTAILPKDGAFDEAQEEFEVSGIDISSLGAGFHKLFLRLKDNEGNWGIVREVTFEIYEPFTIAGAEYFIDEDPRPGQGKSVNAKDGVFDSKEEQIEAYGIDTSSLSGGYHTLYVRFRDSFGRWRAMASKTFNVINDADDEDGDGMPNGWEQSHGLNPLDPADSSQDLDNDGLSNLTEYERFTDPNKSDTDSDGMPDGWEVRYGLRPTYDDANEDIDSDGLTNVEEYYYWTDPTVQDTDGDGVNDGDEVANGTNPRAITSSLTTNVTDVHLSMGGKGTILLLSIANESKMSDSFSLSVSGIDESWYNLSNDEVHLLAGETREIPLEINIPADCALATYDYVVQVTAVSPKSGPVANGGISFELHVSNMPLIDEVYPADNSNLATNSVQISWRTDVDASTDVYYRVLGESDYKHVSGEPGTTHSIILENLKWDRSYEWYAESSGTCGTVATEVRHFSVQDGVVFVERKPSVEINREYNQEEILTIRNRDIVSHNVLVEVINPYEDLICGFVGTGSQDESLVLQAGEEKQVTLAIHAQDAKKSKYYIVLKLTADKDSSNPIKDYTVASVTVKDPVFDLQFVQLIADPSILTNTYRITNNGDTLTDLRVYPDELIAPLIVFEPKIEHVLLHHGESIDFKARYQPQGGVSQYSGVLTVEAAGHKLTLGTHFGCTEGEALHNVTLQDAHVCLKGTNWYCTNRKNISVNLDIPKGIEQTDISRARLYVRFSPKKATTSYRNHDMRILVNGIEVANYLNTIPFGPHAIEVPPALLHTSVESSARNMIRVETRHMNGGHYAIASDFQLILDVDRLSVGGICAATQEEANQNAQSLPYLCSGTPEWEICPKVDSVAVLDESGSDRWNFNPGEDLQFRVRVSNPDIDERALTIALLVDDDFESGEEPYETGETLLLPPETSQYLTFWWHVPEDSNVKSYDVKTRVTSPNSCENERDFPQIVSVNQPFIGYVIDNEVSNSGLSGVEVCASWLGEGNLPQICTTTDQDGKFTLYLPDGPYIITACKETFSCDFVLVPSLGSSVTLRISHNTTAFGRADNSGHAQEPVTTALGNFTLKAKDLSLKGRGINFTFERFYNSQDAYSGPLGHGWTHNYNIRLNQDGDVVTIKFGDGHEEFYVQQSDGSFVSQPGVHKMLTKQADGSFLLTDKEQTSYNFTSLGQLLNIVDKNGNTIALTYENGNLTRVCDPVGRNVEFTYDTSGRITQLQDPLNRTVQFEYDSNGDLVSVTDPMGYKTTYSYDEKHQMISATDPRGNTFVNNTYDEEKRVVTAQSDALGNLSHFSYDEREHVTIITDPMGNKTIHKHDNRHRLTEIIDPLRNEVTIEYDKDNNRTKITDERGNSTNFAYDDRGNLTQVTDALGNVSTITYDQNNNPTEKTDALGHKTTFEYDAHGNLTKITDPLGHKTTIERNQYGQPTKITDARGNTTEYTYDSEGNLTVIRDALGYEVTYSYDEIGRKISSTNQLGHTTSYEYDENDNLIKITDPLPFGYTVINTYDENGNLISTTDRRGNTTSFTYDQKDRLITITDPFGNITSFTYDALDHRTSKTDKRGNTTAYKYDVLGRLIEIIDPIGNRIKKSYDSRGNLVSEQDGMGNMWTYSYDALNRFTKASDPLGNETTYEYDALGHSVKRTDANGNTTQYQYDALGRLIKVIEPGGGEIQFMYDASGNRTGFTNALGNSFSWQYDELNRIVRDADGYKYQYDEVGNLILRTDAKGQQISYVYDELNRLKEIHYPDSSVVTLSYDANGNLVTMSDSLGTTTRQYDAMNRITQVTDPFRNIVKYSYDQEGNRTSITYPDNTTVTYEYDEANRLSSVTDWADRVTSYHYNSAGNVVQITLPNGCKTAMTYDDAQRLIGLNNQRPDTSVICSYRMTLDRVGNRTAIDKAEPLVPFIKNRQITYQYNTQNQIVSMTDGSFSFDDNGSMTSKTSRAKSYTFAWNFDNRLKEWSNGGHTVNYGYDGLTNRLVRTEDGNATRYVLDISTLLTNVLAETDSNGNITATYIYGLGLIAREDAEGIHYYHYDPIGSTIALTDSAGQVTDKFSYDPFGSLANRAGKTQNPFTFVGRFGLMDEGDDIYYVRARYYDSTLGRFLSRDQLFGNPMDPRTLHRYIYAQNNPPNMIDIKGLCGNKSGVDEWLNKNTKWSESLEEILRGFGFATVRVPLEVRIQPFKGGRTFLKRGIPWFGKKLAKLVPKYGKYGGPMHSGPGNPIDYRDLAYYYHDFGRKGNQPYKYFGAEAHERDKQLIRDLIYHPIDKPNWISNGRPGWDNIKAFAYDFYGDMYAGGAVFLFGTKIGTMELLTKLGIYNP